MIELSKVTKSFNSAVKAVDNIDLKVNIGEIFGFLGPNGAGKTTTIKMVTGILAPDNGRILIDGLDITKDPLKAKKQFGFVPDSPNMFLRLKGFEYLNFMSDIYDVPTIINRIADAGVFQLAISGGEPLSRKDIMSIVI